MFNFTTIRASLALTGAIVGVGIFGVPFVFAQAGLAVAGGFFVLITLLILTQHVMYAEVIERTGERHRITGYSEIYFGRYAKNFVGLGVLVSRYGTQLAYIVVANKFLNMLFGPVAGVEYLWGVIFALIFSAGIVLGIRAMERVQIAFVIFLVITIGIILGLGIPRINIENFTTLNLKAAFLPYGVILFSLAGAPAIPEIRAMIKQDGKHFVNSVILGSLLAALLTIAFAVVVLGVSGDSTSEEAISGLIPALGKEAAYLGAIMGILAIATSFLIFGINLKEAFRYDWKLNRVASEVLATAVPPILFLAGLRQFIEIIGVTGAVFGALIGSMTVLVFMRARVRGKKKPKFSVRIPNAISWLIVAAFITGGILEIVLIVL